MPSKEDAAQNKADFPPGSPKAKLNGCTCSADSNHGGIGVYWHGQWTYAIKEGCPLHWWESNYWDPKRENYERPAATLNKPPKIVYRMKHRKKA